MPNKNFIKIENIEITEKILKNLINFDKVIFRNNNFSGDALQFYHEIHYLELSNNLLQKFNFSNLAALKILNISNNNILSLKTIIFPPRLKALDQISRPTLSRTLNTSFTQFNTNHKFRNNPPPFFNSHTRN